MATKVTADTISLPPSSERPRLKFPPVSLVEPIMQGPAKRPNVPTVLMSPMDAAAAIPANKVVGKLQRGRLRSAQPECGQ